MLNIFARDKVRKEANDSTEQFLDRDAFCDGMRFSGERTYHIKTVKSYPKYVHNVSLSDIETLQALNNADMSQI